MGMYGPILQKRIERPFDMRGAVGPNNHVLALDHGWTDRISLTNAPCLDLDLQSPASYGHDLLTHKSSRSTLNGQSVLKIKWKQTDGKTDGGDCITCPINAVGKNVSDQNKIIVALGQLSIKQSTVHLSYTHCVAMLVTDFNEHFVMKTHFK